MVLNAQPIQAAPCTQTKEQRVPFTWSVATGGTSSVLATALVAPGSPAYSSYSKTDTFNATYTTTLSFNPLSQYCSVSNLPKTNILQVTGVLHSSLAHYSGMTDASPNTTYAQLTSSITNLSNMDITLNGIQGQSSYSFPSQDKNSSYDLTVEPSKTYGFNGSLTAYAYKEPLGSGADIIGRLSIDGVLAQSTGEAVYLIDDPVDPPVDVPWETDALSVISSTVLFGLGLWGKCKLTQKQINKEEKNE